MLIPVFAEAFNVNQPLPVDLYLINGDLLYQRGTALSRKQLWDLHRQRVYRQGSSLPIELEHEGRVYWLSALTPKDLQQAQHEESLPSIFSDETASSLFDATRGFLDGLSEGKAADMALLELLRDKLVSEVTQQLDEIQYLTQIRVRDNVTYTHTLHVCALSIALANKVGCTKEEIREIALAAMLHDLGKLIVPKEIMFKSSRLTEREFDIMKRHPEWGYQIIREHLRLPEHIARPALEHQEMHGGGGYPLNLKGNEIHPYSQIVKVADVYDALTAIRPYKNPIPSNRAIEIMQSEGEKSFNPELLEAFSKLSNYTPELKLDDTQNGGPTPIQKHPQPQASEDRRKRANG
jgi:putative nucleotidyltransferase with HDIG domain